MLPTYPMADNNTPAPPSTLAAVGVNLPPSWPADTEVWFAQIEAGHNNSKDSFDYVIKLLSQESALEIRDIFLKPPAENLMTSQGATHKVGCCCFRQLKLQQ